MTITHGCVILGSQKLSECKHGRVWLSKINISSSSSQSRDLSLYSYDQMVSSIRSSLSEHVVYDLSEPVIQSKYLGW